MLIDNSNKGRESSMACSENFHGKQTFNGHFCGRNLLKYTLLINICDKEKEGGLGREQSRITMNRSHRKGLQKT
jgi:hypothetical protein